MECHTLSGVQGCLEVPALPSIAGTCGWVVRDRYLGKIASHRDRVRWIELRIESYAFGV